MAVYVRAKRVTDPLDDKVKARIRGDDRFVTGYASSGSEHDALSGLVHAFLESDGPNSHGASASAAAASDGSEESDSEDGDRSVEVATKVKDLLDPSGKEDPFRLRLMVDVSEAAEALAELRWSGSGYRRAVMVRLREGGYNAGICKARWESSRRLTAGSYEYIDVVVDAAKEVAARYIVDVGFAAEFEVARATEEYGRMVAALPRVMVARPEEVRQVVHIAVEAARRSLRRRGMHVPPWRKGKYMLAKWLGPYRRTVNPLPAAAGAAVAGVGEAKCRAVGFRAVQPVAVSPATRTQ